MVSSVTSSGFSPTIPPKQEEQVITDEQKETIDNILSAYDADNLSESDAQAIVEQFKEAGIEPGKSFASAVSDSGFDAKSIGDLAGVEKKMPPPPPPSDVAENENLPENSTFSITV